MPRPKQEPTATTRVFARDLEAMLKWGPTPALALRALLEAKERPGKVEEKSRLLDRAV